DSVSVPNIHLIATNQSDISVSSVVTLDNQPIGSVVLYGTLQTRILKLQDQLLTVLITMILCFIIAVIIAWRLQRVLTDPVRDLTKTMLHVSSNHDYSIRSSVNTNDELGVLAQGINEMLARVEER